MPLGAIYLNNFSVSLAVWTVFELQLLPSKDQKLLYQLDFEDEQLLFAKVSVSGVTTVPTKEEAEVDLL